MFDAERERLVKRLTGRLGTAKAERRAERPESYTKAFFVPPSGRWDFLRNELQRDVANGLNRALYALEEANPQSLEGVLQHIDFNRQVGSSRIPDRRLRDLIAHFGRTAATPVTCYWPGRRTPAVCGRYRR
jgi:type I restriction enzyme M protein